MSVTKYAQQFNNLSRFATDLVADEKRRCRRFEKGLRPPLKDWVVALRLRTFVDLLDAARAVESKWDLAQKERESRKTKGAGTSGGTRQGQKRKSLSPDSGPELMRSWIKRSSKGSRRSVSDRRLTCHLCEQSGHMMSQCPKLQRVRASVSDTQPQQQGWGSSRPNKPKSIFCYRCDQPGHYAKDCPTRPENAAGSSTAPAPTHQSHVRVRLVILLHHQQSLPEEKDEVGDSKEDVWLPWR